MITYLIQKIKAGIGKKKTNKQTKTPGKNSRYRYLEVGSFLIWITENDGRGSGISESETLSLSLSPSLAY